MSKMDIQPYFALTSNETNIMIFVKYDWIKKKLLHTNSIKNFEEFARFYQQKTKQKRNN